jgi:hypothetical protein
MYRFGKREIVSRDEFHKSKFAESVIEYMNSQIETEQEMYYEHVKLLLFQLAYGTGYELSQITDIYYLVKDESLKDESLKDELENTFMYIKTYILKLSANY